MTAPRLLPASLLLPLALALALPTSAATAASAAATAPGPGPSLPFRNPDLPLEQRVDDLVGRLTRDEKISQLGMGSAPIPRLGVPAYHWWNEGLHGLARNGVATVFPQAIGLAATWNPTLHKRIAEVVATEARAKYHAALRRKGGTEIYQGITIWSPNINIFRDPRWGRGQETYGEDPLLSGLLGVAFVRGLQGNDPRYLHTVATLKHFAVHSGPELSRHQFNATVSARDLRETYLPAFELGVREGGATSVMSAYNAINGTPAPANAFLLQSVLAREWGFTGAIVGDVGNVSDLHNERGHHFAPDAPDAIAAALKAGNDLCSDGTYHALPAALERGLVQEADLDRALRHLFTLRFRLGMFDSADRVPWAKTPESAVDAPEHDQLALEAARQSLVLLKNDGALPLDPAKVKRVAILGPTGDDHLCMLGNYAGTPARPTTLVQALQRQLGARGIAVTYDPAVPLVAGFREGGRPFSDGVIFGDASRASVGLKRELFTPADFSGAPTDVRHDAQIDFYWNPAQPVPGLPLENVALRWTGVLVPRVSGEHELAITYIGAAQLFVDDQPVAGNPTHGNSVHNAAVERVSTAKLMLEQRRAYRIRLEYTQRPGSAVGRIQFGWRPPGGLDAALAQARTADHILLTLGITPALEGEAMSVKVDGFVGGDRTSMLLPQSQRDLLDRVAALGKPFTVVLCNGSALSFDVVKPNAVVEAWYYGQRGGDALAELLLGDLNPAGRLPVTFYRADADLPPFENYAMAGRTYRYFTGTPLFAFGHGLSYTTFAYGQLALPSPKARADETVRITVPVRNTGRRDGEEVVQLYVTSRPRMEGAPLRHLVAFQRVPVKAGGAAEVVLDLPCSRLRRWDEAGGRYVVDPGIYEFFAGPASDRPLTTARLTIAP
ncbi:glycoside hydrolase family 3 C-terminal domain-containing protein [Opitutus sp. ER46]|uniref:glycoside hydrolase family 3 C-terminal domain-containing protein n=1 Tax=Opitutus sp. ER46 TaxID=2161864 RepID=UPI000D324362|nr:glycoside hydrolase family 3 C-terminal domain-containing protein [Opitutus sp. ER46]PTX92291.1 glucan 1,4-alpha-glucosidase [Opitutus sp. ER46]